MIKFGSIILIASGFFILIYPEIISYIIAFILITLGINGIFFSNKFNRFISYKVKIDK